MNMATLAAVVAVHSKALRDKPLVEELTRPSEMAGASPALCLNAATLVKVATMAVVAACS